MDLIKLDSSKIEKAMYDYLVLNNVAPNIYGGSRNVDINKDVMVYCNAPLPIYDKEAIGDSMVRIEIYVKKIGGWKNAARLSEIRDAIVPLFPKKLGEDYFFDYLEETTGSDKAGYDFIFITLNVVVLS